MIVFANTIVYTHYPYTHTSILILSMSRCRRICLEEAPKFFGRQAGLLDNGFQGSALEVLIMEGEGDPEMRLVRMFEDMVATRRVVHKKPGPLQGPEDLAWPECGEALAHTVGSTTVTCSLTGSSRSALSDGIGWPSFCKLSK
jgi:hypothetical protein